MGALTKYWFLEGFDLFKKLGMPTMMRMCEALEMENIDRGHVHRNWQKGQKKYFFSLKRELSK